MEPQRKKKNIWQRGGDQKDDEPLTATPARDEKEESEKEKDATRKEDGPSAARKKKGKQKGKKDKEKDDPKAKPEKAKGKHHTDGEKLDMHGVDPNEKHETEKEKEPTLVRTAAAAFVNWLLMCAFAVAQGAIIFIDEPNWRNIAMAMNMNLISAGVLGFVVSLKSEARIFIAGPDLTSCILIGDSISKMSNYIATKLEMGIVPVPHLAEPRLCNSSESASGDSSRRLTPEAEDSEWHLDEGYVNEWWMDVEQTKFSALSLSSWLPDISGWSMAIDDDINDIDNHSSSPEDSQDTDNDYSIFRRLSARRRRRRRRRTTTTTTSFNLLDMDPRKFCTGGHYKSDKKKCWYYHIGLRCTLVVMCMMASFTTGITLFFLGYLKLTRFVEFVPRGITDAFSAVLGIKTFTAAVRICLMLPKFFAPAMVVGVLMYFVLVRRIGNPAVTMPLFIVVPCVMWTAHLKVSEISMPVARQQGLYLPELPNEMAWDTYSELRYPQFIHWEVWRDVYPEMISLIALLVINSLANGLRASEDCIPIFIHRDFETKIAGIANLAMTPLAGIPGFAQFRLNLCNYGTQLNVQDKRAGMIYAALCFLSAFAPKQQVLLHVPRNIFAIVLFCGGAGYIAEHLWNSRKYLSFPEWSQIVAIIVVFGSWDSVPYAMVLGSFLVGVQFICKLAQVPCIDGVPLHGGELVSRERHEPLMMRSICHIANSWVVIIKLQGYVMFSAVSYVTHHIRDIMHKQEEEQVPEFRRLKFVILDGAELNGMECSASKALEKLRETATAHGVAVLWSSLQPEILDDLVNRNVLPSEADTFLDLYEAMLEIEQHIRVFRNNIQERWVNLHPMFKQAADLMRMRENFEPFRSVFPFDAARFGCPWIYCSKRKIRAFDTVLWEDDMADKELFLIHTGAVGIFRELPSDSEDWKPPEVIYKHGWFVNRQFLFREPTELNAIAMEDGEVLSWNSHQWWKMVREKPIMAASIMEVAMRQMAFDAQVVSSLFAAGNRVEVDDEGEIDLSHMSADKGELMCPTAIPYDLAHQIQGLEAAQFLKEFKLYEPIEADSIATALPEMPKKIRDDLTMAFWTYATEGDNGKYALAAHKVKEALMYAGIFNMLAVDVEQQLDEKEFIAVGHETALTRLSKKQVAKIYNIFKSYDKDKSGHLERDEIVTVFRETFHPTISEDEVNGLVGAWDDNGSGQIEAKEFVGILSRFIRKHEPDWNLLLGFREILKKHKKEKITHKDRLTAEHLTQNKHYTMTLEEAEEMLWACDCFDLEGDGKELDLAGFVAAVILNTEYTSGRLPPRPRKPPRKGEKDPQQVDDGSKVKKINAKPRKSKKRKEENADDADEPQEDANEEDDTDGAKRASQAEDDEEQLKKTETRLPSTRMLKNGVMPSHGVGKTEEIPNTSKARMRTMFEYPQSSRRAQIYSYVMALFIVLSMAKPAIEVINEASSETGFCPKAFPYEYHNNSAWCCQRNREKKNVKGEGKSCDGSKFHAGGVRSRCCRGNRQVKCPKPPCSNYAPPTTGSADTVAFLICLVFTLEYLLRLWVCKAHNNQKRWQFILNPFNLCDLGSILPFWYAMAAGTGDSPVYRMMRVMRFMRLTKNARLQKVGKRAGIFAPMMVVFFVILGSYYRAYSAQNS